MHEHGRALVVGAAILDAGRVLAARRTAPPETAGRWELPGGKVEAGEAPEDALVREIGEELGCRIEVSGWLAGAVAVQDRHLLRVAVARLVEGTPLPVEHDQVRWLDAASLDEVDWLEPDRPFLAELARRLGPAPGRHAAPAPREAPGADSAEPGSDASRPLGSALGFES